MKLTYTKEEVETIVRDLAYVKGTLDARALKEPSDTVKAVLDIIDGGKKKE